MEKQRFNKGFTLIEMLLVVTILGILFAGIVYVVPTVTTFSIKKLEAYLLYAQSEAIHDKKKVMISFYDQKVKIMDRVFEIGMHCTGDLYFLENGNVNHAQTIVCSKNGKKEELVVLLGSGRMYVR